MVVLASQISLLWRQWNKSPKSMTATVRNISFKLWYRKNETTEHVQSPKWCASWVTWPDLAGVHSEETIQEDKNANQGSRDQHAGVPAQPRKVKTDFLPKVPPRRESHRSTEMTISVQLLTVCDTVIENESITVAASCQGALKQFTTIPVKTIQNINCASWHITNWKSQNPILGNRVNKFLVES